jgi:hypothetical protein
MMVSGIMFSQESAPTAHVRGAHYPHVPAQSHERGCQMARCTSCGGPLRQVHRRFYERLMYSGVYTCRDCDSRVRRVRGWSFSTLRFLCSRYTNCIRCSSDQVHRMRKKDRIDTVSKHPISRLLQLFGAPRNKCPLCRLQYHDLRRVRPALSHGAEALPKT